MYTAKDEERRHGEPASETYRSAARRDAARIIHSPAFRRLNGKTQLFPGLESDFFRTRLTHSLEVGQIAKSIAIRLNATEDALKSNPIDADYCELAGWAHDIGHPPFGHEGENALHACIATAGGFEGNAHTLRLLARISKKVIYVNPRGGISDSGVDERVGLNLAARSLASVLKYDNVIPRESDAIKPTKGYYKIDSGIVEWLKEQVLGSGSESINKMKTVECSIMDIADDIAYSTYDLEDAFHAGFISPVGLMGATRDVLERVVDGVNRQLDESLHPPDILEVVRAIFLGGVSNPRSADESEFDRFRRVLGMSAELTGNGAARTRFTSALVGNFIQNVEFSFNKEHPAISKVWLAPEVRRQVEVLKQLSYNLLVDSPMIRTVRYRAREIVRVLFETLVEDPQLLPEDWYVVHNRVPKGERLRTIADFVACMTDRYAVEFYGRLRSESPQSVFKPI